MSLGGATINTEEPRVLSLRITQSAYGSSIARVWGTQRIPGNLLWYGDFTPIAHTTTQSSGGKGGGVESSNTSYTYRAALLLGLCSGEVAGVGKVWADKSRTTLTALGLTFKSGALGQAAWSHLAANHPTEAVNYSGIAWVANAAFDLGSSPSLPNLTFELQGERITAGGNGDAEAADIITDIIADPVEGLGLPSSTLADMTAYRAWCAAMGLTLSLAATSQKPARDHIADTLKATLSDVIWSQSKLKVIPYGDHPVGAWVPNTTAVYDLDEGDLLAPPKHHRKQPAEAINRVTLTYSDRAKDYNAVPVMRDDLAAVTQFGARPESLDLSAITEGGMAATVCEFWRDRNLYIRNTWELPLDERFCRLEPMDLLTLTYGPQALDHEAVCVVRVEEDEDGEDGLGRLLVLVEEWPFGLARPASQASQPAAGYTPEQSVAPGAVNAPVIFEAPNAVTAPNLEIWVGVSGGIHWGGCHVWASDDNATYQQVGTITNPARHGTLTSALAAGSDPDTAHTLYVELTASRGQLNSGTQNDADSLNTLLWVDGELIAYQTATLTDVNRYSLTYLRRGAKGTAIAGHASGAKFTRLDDAIFRYVVPRERIGRPLWLKFQSFNQFGLSPEPLDTVSAYNYTIQGNKPLPLVTLTAGGGMFENQLQWAFAAGQIGIDYVELWGATSNDRSQALPLTSQKNTVLAWKHPGLAPAQDWYYWGRVIDTSTNQSDFYPSSATGGVHAAPTADPSALLTQLQNSIGLQQLTAELANPILQVPDATASAQSAAEAALRLLLKSDALKAQAQRDKWILDATTEVDPATGTVTLLATAAITTDVEAHLNQVNISLGAMDGTIQSHTATLSVYGGRITTAETSITQLQGDIALKASSAYVDTELASALGEIDPVNVAAASQYAAEGLLQTLLDVDAGRKRTQSSAMRLAVAESTLSAHATALTAEADARTALAAQVAGTAASLVDEQAVRAAADSANANDINTLEARLDTGDYAAVKQESSATANKVGAIEAKYAVKVDVNGHVTGIELIQNGTTGAFVILADKLLVTRPDGTGTPRQMMVLGTINGQTALGLAGNMIVDGSIVAASLAVNDLSAITANLGHIESGDITLDATGFIRGGQTDFDTGAGFFLGYSVDAFKFSVGDGATHYLRWDGTTLSGRGDLQPRDYQPGTWVVIASNGQVSIGGTGWTKGKDIMVVRGGVLTVEYSHVSGANGDTWSQVWINGVAVGAARTVGPYGSATFSENHSVATGDRVQVYGGAAGGGPYCRISNFSLKCAFPVAEQVFM